MNGTKEKTSTGKAEVSPKNNAPKTKSNVPQSRKKSKALAASDFATPHDLKTQWGGIAPGDDVSLSDAQKNDLIMQVAQVYRVPPTGIVIMGSKPYLNKEARLYLLQAMKKGKKRLIKTRTKFLHMAADPKETAVAQVFLTFADGLEVDAIGEAGPHNISQKMVKVANSPNMVAETRAMNRAIYKAIGGEIWARVEKNLKVLKGVSAEKIRVISNAGKVSAEEMDQPQQSAPKPQKTDVPSSKEDMERLLQNKVRSCKDVNVLIQISEKLKDSKKYSAQFKKEIQSEINIKVDKLTK